MNEAGTRGARIKSLNVLALGGSITAFYHLIVSLLHYPWPTHSRLTSLPHHCCLKNEEDMTIQEIIVRDLHFVSVSIHSLSLLPTPARCWVKGNRGKLIHNLQVLHDLATGSRDSDAWRAAGTTLYHPSLALISSLRS